MRIDRGAARWPRRWPQGFVKAGLTTADRLLASDVDEHARQRFAQAVAAHTTADNALVAAQSDVIILAVKPQQMPQVAAGLRGSLPAARLVRLDCRGRPAGLAGRMAGAGACGWCASCQTRRAWWGKAPAPTAWASTPRPRTAHWSARLLGAPRLGLAGGREAAGRGDRPVRLRAGLRVRDDRGPQRCRREDGPAADHGHADGGPDGPRRRRDGAEHRRASGAC